MNLYLENKRLNEAELKEKKRVLKSMPLSLRIILNNQCNTNCIMCDIFEQKNKFSIPYEVIRQINYFFPYLERIDWQGGEVFLVEHFEEMLREVSLYSNIHQTLQTNGLLLDRKWSELLAKYDATVLFSVDSTKKETYEYIRRGGRFEDLLDNIAVFNEYKEKYCAKSAKVLCVCLMRANYDELEEFVSFAIKYKFNRISFGALHGSKALNENIFSPADKKALGRIKENMPLIEKICEENNIILDCSFKAYLGSNDEATVTKPDTEDGGKEIKCKLPWTNLCIDAIRGGDVYPECLCSKSVGNIMRDPLVNAWNSPLMQQYRSVVLSGNIGSICSEYCGRIK